MKLHRTARFAGVVLVMVSVGAFFGCSLLPITVQSRHVAARLGVSSDEITAVARKAAAENRLEAQWIGLASNGAIEVGLGKGPTQLSILFRRADRAWVEVPDSRYTWSTSSDLPTPPFPNSF